MSKLDHATSTQDRKQVKDFDALTNRIIDEIFTLPTQYRGLLLERLIFAFIEDPKKRLIVLLHELNATQSQIAKALDVKESLISRKYPKGAK